MSPLLFNIFISKLPESLDVNNSEPLHVDETETLNSVIWADDLLMLSESEQSLNNMLKNLEKYTKNNLLEVNLEKTKCMIFNKTGRLIRRNFWFENKKVDVVREYKYLGFLITPSLDLHTALVDLKDRGLRAYGAMKTRKSIQARHTHNYPLVWLPGKTYSTLCIGLLGMLKASKEQPRGNAPYQIL